MITNGCERVWHRRLLKAINYLGWPILAAVVAKRIASPLFDPDLFWHLATGRWIVEHRTFLRSDVFSFSTFNAPWQNSEWIFQVLVYVTESLGGWAGLFWLKMALALGSLALLGGTLFRLLGPEKRWFLPMVWIGYAILQPRLFERAELFTWICWGGLWMWILNVRRCPNKPWALFWVVPLFTFWVNCHPGVVYGVGFIFLLCLGARWEGESKEFIRRLDQALGLALCCLILNPHGWRMAWFYLDVMTQLKTNIGIIAEWKSPTLADAPYFWVVLVGVGYLSVAAVREKTASWRWLVPAAFVFVVYGSQHLRSTALAAWTGLALIAFALREASFFSRVRFWGPVALTIVLAATTVYPLFKSPLKTKMVAWSRLPQGPVDFMQRHRFEGRGYNEYGFGGYIQWVLGPELKTFLDGRYLSFPLAEEETQMLFQMASNQNAQAWTRRSDRWGFQFAVTGYMSDFWDLWEKKSGHPDHLFFDRFYPPREWALVYWDDVAMVFCRRNETFRSLIKENEYIVLKPYLLINRSIDAQDRDRAVEEITRHRREVPFSMLRSQIEGSLSS